MKKVALFIPCFVDSFYPRAAEATLGILENLGFDVTYPLSQTCCGQPFANSGEEDETRVLASKFIDIFSGYDYIVSPSASCVSMVKNHYQEYLPPSEKLKKVQNSIYEICEFLYDVVKIKELNVTFAHRVGLHQSCHGLRELELGVGSELVKPLFSKARYLLELVKGIEIVDLERPDECCGFGGTFSVNEPDISIKMGKERLQDHINAKAEYITGFDSSCLMHLEGIAKYEKYPVKIVHIAEILSGMADESS